MLAHLKQGEDIGPVEVEELDEEVRRGRVLPSHELFHPPWTGEEWVRVADLPELAEALDTPNARFVWHLSRWRMPWLSTLVTLTIFASGLAVEALRGATRRWELAASVYEALYEWMPVGAAAVLADGLWWTPISSQLLHADLMHVTWNLLFIGYCGFRVERGLGPGGYAVVAAAGVLGGSLLICLFGKTLVMGSSILGFGLWGAQIGIGVRMWGALPPHFKGRYGISGIVFLFFAALYARGFYSAQISHLGHLGGLLGGMAAAMVLEAESLVPRARMQSQARRNGLIAVLLVVLPGIGGQLLGRSPHLAWRSWTTETSSHTGISLSMPQRMRATPVWAMGVRGWSPPGGEFSPLFAVLQGVNGEGLPPEEDLAKEWAERLEGTLRPREVAAAPPGEGWMSHSWWVDRPGDPGPTAVVEHRILRGRWVYRVGYLLPPGPRAALPGGREALYEEVLATVDLGEPPDLLEARAKHERNPRSPSRIYDLALELGFLGELAQAQEQLELLDVRTDGWQWTAARLRLSLWLEFHEGDSPERRQWVQTWLHAATLEDTGIHLPGVALLLRWGACEEAAAHGEELWRRALVERSPEELSPGMTRALESLDDEPWSCEAQAPRLARPSEETLAAWRRAPSEG